MTRRQFGLATGAASLAGTAFHVDAAGMPKQKVAIFSKHLQFLVGEDLARSAAEIGFDGVDLTVRKGGHVEPAEVVQKLPELVKLIRAHGLEVAMVTADITDARSPHAEDILRTLASLEIPYYRWGGFTYDDSPLAGQLAALKPRVAALAALNAKYQVCAMYHTHSGIGVVGAPIWDLYVLLKDFDPNAVAVNYDIGHATVEGGFGGWIDSFRITEPMLRGVAVKDAIWEKIAPGDWKSEWVPLGTGMVRFQQFFAMLAKTGFHGPLQLHFEYPLGGADQGKTKLTMQPSEVFAAMKRDLRQLRGFLA